MTPDLQRVETIRHRLSLIEAREWQVVADGAETMLVSVAPLNGGVERIPIASFTGFATTEEMMLAAAAPGDLRFLLGLFDRAVAHARRQKAAERAADQAAQAPKNFAAECAIKCAEPAFKKFLMERNGLESPATDDRAAQHVRTLLRISSRAELNDGGHAEAAWLKLRGEFEAWRRQG